MAQSALQAHQRHFGRDLVYRDGDGVETPLRGILAALDPAKAEAIGIGLEDLVHLVQITVASGSVPSDDPDARIIDDDRILAIHQVQTGRAGEDSIIAGDLSASDLMRL